MEKEILLAWTERYNLQKRCYNCMLGTVDNEKCALPSEMLLSNLFFYYYTLIYFAITWMYAAIFIDLTSPDYKTWLIVGSTTVDKFVHMYIYFYLFQIFQDFNFFLLAFMISGIWSLLERKNVFIFLPLLIFKRKWLQTCIVDR